MCDPNPPERFQQAIIQNWPPLRGIKKMIVFLVSSQQDTSVQSDLKSSCIALGYCLVKNDNKDLPCLWLRFYIHLNWRLAGCTEWRWIWSHLLEVLDRRSGKERGAPFWHTLLENHLSKFSISEKAACHLLCTSNQAQGWIWSASMLYSCCKAYSSSWYLVDKLKKRIKKFL